MSTRALSWVVWASLGAGPAVAQRVPTVTWTKPVAAFPEPFSEITAVRELRDGRVLVVDQRELSVALVDFARGTSVVVGRKGPGPGEYQWPNLLHALPGDSSALQDNAARTLLIIGPDGKTGGELDPREGLPAAAAALFTGVRFVDAQGRMYSQAQPIRFLPDGTRQLADSSAIIRWTRGAARRDTVAWLPLIPDPTRQVSPTGGVFSRPRMDAYRADPTWGVAPDGRVMIVTADPYRVDVFGTDGRLTRGTPIPYERLKVSDAHRKAFMDEVARPRMGMRRTRDGQTTIGLITPGAGPEPWQFPEYLPPYWWDAAKVASDGTVWVKRLTAMGAAPTWDVIDGGRLVRRVVLPPRANLVGFGAGTVYVVQLDADDLQTLQRFSLR